MRVIYFLFLLAFAAVVGVFVYLNNHDVSVRLPDQTREVSFPLLVGVTYGLGMLSGWTVVGMLRRSWSRVIDERA